MTVGKTETTRFLQQWHGGDQKGLDALLERHLPWIQDHVSKRLGPLLRMKADPSDYVQDAVVQFLRYGPRIMVSNENHFRALLVRVIENALRDKHDWFTALRRANAKDHPLPSDTVLSLDPPRKKVSTPSKEAQHHEDEAWIRLGMELLDPKDREVLVLRQWEGLSYDEIGKRLGISRNAAWKKNKRAVFRLAKKVGELRRRQLACILEGSPS
jgi:RNA polymerase sigma-70 factor (ECF subfamily)